MKDNKNRSWEYITYIAVGMIIFFVSAAIWQLFTQTDPLMIVKILSDSFTLPGALFIGVALLGWISSKGVFDIFGYSMKGLFSLWKKESYYKQESFYDYRVQKDEKRKPFNLPMLLVGLVFLLFGVVMMIAFLMME